MTPLVRSIGPAVAIAFLAAALSAQQERFTDQVAVTEVEVPVRVLSKGEPLRGLTREDFLLFEEGEPREILGFSVRELAADPLAPPPAPGDVSRSSGRSLMLLVDFSFSRRQRLANALEEVRESLTTSLSPGDRVAVATWGYVSGLNLLVGFTDDRAKINLALDAVQAMLDAKRGRQREHLGKLHDARFSDPNRREKSSTFDVLAEELSPGAALAVLGGPVIYDEAEDAGVVVEEQRTFFSPIQVWVEVDVTQPIDTAQDLGVGGADLASIRSFGLSLTELAYLLREVGGQKDLILLSEGFSGGLLNSSHSLFYLQKALRALRDSGWTLHGIDVGGIPGLDDDSFTSNSLLYMSDATGGDLVENVNDFGAAAARVLGRTEVVYVLTFEPSPADGDTGSYRKINVKLVDPPRRTKILHRPGYYTDRSMKEREVFEQRVDAASWLLTNLEARELAVQAFAQTLTDPLGGMRTDLVVEVDGRSLLEARTMKKSKLELQILVRDESHRIRELLTAETVIDFKRLEDRFGRGGLRFVGELGLPPGKYDLRALVRNHRGGQVVLDSFTLAVGAGIEPEAALGPPPADRSEKDWFTVEMANRSAYFR